MIARSYVALVPLALAPWLGACAAPASRAPTPPPRVAQEQAPPRFIAEHISTPRDSILETAARMTSLVEFVDAHGRPSRNLPSTLEPVQRDRPGLAGDIWGRSFRYVPRGLHFELRSAGPDASFETDDDVVMLGQLGRSIPCEVRMMGRVVRREDRAPPCVADAEVLVLPLCPLLVSSLPVVEARPATARDSVLLTGRRLVRFARGVDETGRRRGGLPPSMQTVPGYPRAGDGWEFADAWERAVRYVPRGRTFEMRSSGADGAFDTRDDIVVSAELGRTIPCAFQTEDGAVTCEDAPPPCPEGPAAGEQHGR